MPRRLPLNSHSEGDPDTCLFLDNFLVGQCSEIRRRRNEKPDNFL